MRFPAVSLVLMVVLSACPAPVAVPDGGEPPDAAVARGDDAGLDAGEPGDPCDTVSCGTGTACVNGTCVVLTCGNRVCTAQERCVDGGVCLDERCTGVTCLATETCVAGSCLSTVCLSITCAAGQVCVDDACVDAACAAVSCDGGTCVAGRCEPPSCGDAGACLSTQTCVNAQCTDARCVGVSCAMGFECDAGACVAGCTPSASTETACADGRDDDCDGQVDCADSDCAGQACTDDGKACSRDVCQGGGCAHPAITAGTECRASIGGCDVAERCDGTALTCPADAFDPACTCPYRGSIAGFSEGDGVRSISATSFVLRDTNTWARYAALIDGLGLPKVGLDVLPLNRTASAMPAKSWPGFGGGFFWEAGDLNVSYWVPQGLGGGVAGARSMVAVAWHYDETKVSADPNPPSDGTDKGVRLTFADVTSLSAGVSYRHVLLVEPDATRGFKPIPIHGGGVAWSGSLLYVADTNRGLRVFDLTRVLEVSSAAACSDRCGVSGGVACAYGYSYVLPQVGGYYFPSGLSASCQPNFSFVSLDRSTAPDSLISGEYDNDPTWGLYSRVFRWTMASGTSRLATGPTGVVTASGAWYAGQRNLQGGVASNGKFFLNSTRSSGALYTGVVGSPTQSLLASQNEWGWMPEGMHISAAGNLWVSTEGHTNLDRSVYFVRIAQLP
ncbi:MAG: hypothetical protein U0228_30670 [Myxococcaceae bacterium]